MIHAATTMLSLPGDVVVHVASFLNRKDGAALAQCCRSFAGLASVAWADWFNMQCVELDLTASCFERYDGFLAALGDHRMLPRTTRLVFNFDAEAGNGDGGGEIQEVGGSEEEDDSSEEDDGSSEDGGSSDEDGGSEDGGSEEDGSSSEEEDGSEEDGEEDEGMAARLALVDLLVARASNVAVVKATRVPFNPTRLARALCPLEHLRWLDIVVDATDLDATPWRFDTLPRLTGLSIHAMQDAARDAAPIRVPSGLTALRLSGYDEAAQNWDMDKILPAGLRKLGMIDVFCDNIDYSRLPHLDTLIFGNAVFNLHDLPDSLTSLRIAFDDDDLGHGMMVLDDDVSNLFTIRISHLTRLRDLEIALMINPDDEKVQMQSLSKLTDLTRLSLKRFGRMDTAVLASSFPRLTDLCVDVHPAPHGPPIPPLPDAPLLSTLHLSLAGTAEEQQAGDENMNSPLIPVPLLLGRQSPALDLCRYTHLHSLLLHCAQLDRPSALHLLSLPSLRTLTLVSCKMAESVRALLTATTRFVVLFEGDAADPRHLAVDSYFGYDVLGH